MHVRGDDLLRLQIPGMQQRRGAFVVELLRQHRAMAGHSEDDYVLTDGERVTSSAIGWNFGDGHMHNEQLIAAMQQRCRFAPGEVRVVLLDAQPIYKQTQAYRLVDAATGEFEHGIVKVSDMVTRQPWADDVPIELLPPRSG